jgi:hypothetical protein
MLCFSIRLMSSDSDRYAGGVVILSFTSRVQNLPLAGVKETFSDWVHAQTHVSDSKC